MYIWAVVIENRNHVIAIKILKTLLIPLFKTGGDEEDMSYFKSSFQFCINHKQKTWWSKFGPSLFIELSNFA